MSELDTKISGWDVLCSAVAAGTEPTDLAVTERTYATVVAAIAAAVSGDEKITIYRIAESVETPANSMRFRCISVTDTAVNAFNVYSGTLGKDLDCELSLLGVLSFTTGTQASIVAGYEMASQLAVTEGGTSTSFVGITTADDDRIAETSIDLQGSDLLIIVPVTVGADCKLIGKSY